MKALSVLVLRFKQPEAREWKVPLNFRLGRMEIPVGLGLITLALFTLAVANVLTKKVATISGMSFTLAFFIIFEVSEHLNKRRKAAAADAPGMEQFRLSASEEVTMDAVQVRPGNILVAARNPYHLEHLAKTLEKTDTRKQDIVVATVHTAAPHGEAASLDVDQVFSADEQLLFSRVVTIAEKAGKHVELLVVPGADSWLALAQTAQKLGSSRIVAGLSAKYDSAILGKVVGEAWEKLPAPRPSLSLEVVLGSEKSVYFNLGPHPPRLWPEDVALVHQLWLDLSARGFGAKLHHRDVVGVALRRLARDLNTQDGNEVLTDISAEVEAPHPTEPATREGQ